MLHCGNFEVKQLSTIWAMYNHLTLRCTKLLGLMKHHLDAECKMLNRLGRNKSPKMQMAGPPSGLSKCHSG